MNEVYLAVHEWKTHHKTYHRPLDYKHTVCKYGYTCYSTSFLMLHSTINLRQCLDATLQLSVMLKSHRLPSHGFQKRNGHKCLTTTIVIVWSASDFTRIVLYLFNDYHFNIKRVHNQQT